MMKTVTDKVLLILAVIIPALCQTQIETTSKTITQERGKTAELECKVKNLQSSQTVIWKFVDHNQTISTGDTIRADVLNSKYSIVQSQDGGGYWNLQIFRVDLGDKGTYKCYISGMEDTQKVVHHLEIIGAPTSSPPPELNVTDCCVSSGVEKCALPMCDTSSSLVDLIKIAMDETCMTNNIVQVLSCGQDGRNHMGCCIRRGLSDLCQHLCGQTVYFDNDYTSCIDTTTLLGLVQCFKEGNVLLPSPPTGVSAINAGTALVVTWQPPVENSDVVVGYKIQYRKIGDDFFNSTKSLASNTQVEKLVNLEVDEVYEIQVVAVASSGASQPSLPIYKATEDVIPLSNYTKTVRECCENYNVSTSCQGYCDASMYYTGGHPDMLQCLSEINVIYQCIAGHGNHTGCCKRVGVPEACWGYCRGEPNLSWETVQCLPYMNRISACVIEGSVILPGPPQNTSILVESVTSSSAIVTWDPPENSKPGDYYTVSWKIGKVSVYNWTHVDVYGTEYKLTGLEPATVYEIVVSTVNARGSSLPELTLILVTEGESAGPVPPFNETECCIKKNVSTKCLKLCEHEFRLSDEVLAFAFECFQAVEPMLLCATDGRDHRKCCSDRGISPECLGLCNLQPGVTPSTSFVECVTQKDALSICFDEGKAVLPRSPENVTVQDRREYSIVIDWKPPGGGPNITSYTVEYSLDGMFWMKELNTSHTYLAVNKLKPDTDYYFRVTSNNEKGQSTPSNVIKTDTKPAPINKTEEEWMQLWQNRTDCCTKSNISSDCQSTCLSGVREDLDTRKCYADIDKIIACGADGRDHSDCCTRKIPGFSLECLPYCQGQPGSRDVTAALCLTFLGPILTCFTEGQGLLPTPPQYVKAAAQSSTEIIMKWKPPASNCNSSCTFVTYIWEDSNKTAIQRSRTTEYSYVFSKLKPVTRYRVAVASYNRNGMSLPSPYVILTTLLDSKQSVTVTQSPPDVIDSGSPVKLGCVGFGGDLDSVKWTRNSKDIFFDNLYTINAVKDTDQGLYTCEVTFADGEVLSNQLTLNVRYRPVAKKMTEKTVLPGVGQDAKLVCEFEGFPHIVDWFKEGKRLYDGTKYTIPRLVDDLVKSKTTSVLVVTNVVSDDFGSYTCKGSNRFGEMHSTGNLRNMFPVTPIPTSAPPNKTDVAECCRLKGVPLDCSSQICTYDIDINNIFSNAALTHCANYLTEFFACGADGKDHTKCCTRQGVPEACLPFCAGVIPEHDNPVELLVCLPHGQTLINCAIHGAQYIPSPPTNVQAKVMYDTVQVTWDAPKENADKVDVYHIYYKSKSLPKTFDAASKLSRLKALQPELIKKGETYTVWLKAINDFGSSNMSEHVTVMVTALVPPAPINLRATPLPNNTIKVSWEPPNTKLVVKNYALHYHTIDGPVRIVYPLDSPAWLVKLRPNTKYIISVAGVGYDGEGKKTKSKSVTTVESSIKPKGPEAHSGHETVGVVVGVILGLIFLVAVAVLAVILFRRFGKPRSVPNQTVAFENPQYSSGPRVTGLPGDSESNSFQYGKLQEEQDHEDAYVTLDNSQTNGTSTDNPATLELDQA